MTARDSSQTDIKKDAKYPPVRRTVTVRVPSVPKFNPPRGVMTQRIISGMLIFLIALGGSFAGVILANNQSVDGIFGGVKMGDEKKIETKQSQIISKIVETAGPSVVSVNVAVQEEVPSSDFGGFAFPGLPEGRESLGAGTGIIVSKDGIVVTNRHVVPEGVTRLSLTLSDGTELENVSVIGRTSSSDSLDIAFLKINDAKGRKLKPAAIGDSSKVEVGDDVIAIGNALGRFQNTVTSGIVSGFGRNVLAGDDSGGVSSAETLDNLFQTDAAINSGNSGGPLMNLNGQVIGINTAVAGGDAQNIGFAIPINDIRGLLTQVLKTGKFERPYLGVRYVLLNPEVADEYDLERTEGAFIVPSVDMNNSSVLENSPAERAGIKERDIIISVDNKKLDRTHSLTSLLAQFQPGEDVELGIIRDGKSTKVMVKLGTLPSTPVDR